MVRFGLCLGSWQTSHQVTTEFSAQEVARNKHTLPCLSKITMSRRKVDGKGFLKHFGNWLKVGDFQSPKVNLLGTITYSPTKKGTFESMIFPTSRLVGYVIVPWRVPLWGMAFKFVCLGHNGIPRWEENRPNRLGTFLSYQGSCICDVYILAGAWWGAKEGVSKIPP